MKKPTVFISYSHDNEQHKEKVLSFANQLYTDDVDCIFDQYEVLPAYGWMRWMENGIDEADFVILICTETYYKRVMGKEKKGIGLGGKFEGKIIYNKIYHDDCKNEKFLPVVFNNNDRQYIPELLKDFTNFFIKDDESYEDLYRVITSQSKIEMPKERQPRILKPKSVGKLFDRKNDRPAKIDTIKLPITEAKLFGREKELEMLDNAWNNPNLRILSFVAWGGVGKSALINEWLNKMDEENYRGAEMVYGWSFYSQGTKEQTQASADTFFNDAIKWFGFEGEIPTSQHEKGRLLADIISRQKTLLILDGLEPLQYPAGEMHGLLKDKTMPGLLKSLIRSMNGLCVITSRCTVKDLKNTEGRLSLTHYLSHLSKEAGSALLKTYHLKGNREELEQTSLEFDNHALALHLTGSYLKTYHDGDIKKAK